MTLNIFSHAFASHRQHLRSRYLVAPIFAKESSVMRDPIGPDETLAVTLRYLVTGDTKRTIAAS